MPSLISEIWFGVGSHLGAWVVRGWGALVPLSTVSWHPSDLYATSGCHSLLNVFWPIVDYCPLIKYLISFKCLPCVRSCSRSWRWQWAEKKSLALKTSYSSKQIYIRHWKRKIKRVEGSWEGLFYKWWPLSRDLKKWGCEPETYLWEEEHCGQSLGSGSGLGIWGVRVSRPGMNEQELARRWGSQGPNHIGPHLLP